MSIINEVTTRGEKAPYVEFHRVPVENKAESIKQGKYICKDVDYAHVTAPYSRDVYKQKVTAWFDEIKQQAQQGRFPPDLIEKFTKQYNLWKEGQEMPIEGTPVRGWGVISPAQQETLIKMHVLTVEDVATMNDEGIKRMGMGGVEVKNKAKAWLAQLADKGPLTMHVAKVERENEILKSSVEALQKQVATLVAHVKTDAPEEVPHETSEITASDLIDDDDIVAQYEAKFGKKPHHKMKPETIREALK